MTARAARPQSRALPIPGRQAVIARLSTPAAARERLQSDPAYAAYALSYTDTRLFRLARFFDARAGERRALLVHARGGLGLSTLLMGDTRLVAHLLALHPGPAQTLLTCEPDHVDAALGVYHLWRPQLMVRMRLDRDAFTPPTGLPPVRRLVGADARDVNALYALEGDGIWYSPRQIGEAIYFGTHHRGRLVAAAGTHIQSVAQGTAVVGNVFTHPDFRGRGFGTAVTAAVTSHLLRDHPLTVLSVDPANRTARKIYEGLGYREAGRLIEAMATRRSRVSPLPLLRRIIARWRSDSPGLEVVDL